MPGKTRKPSVEEKLKQNIELKGDNIMYERYFSVPSTSEDIQDKNSYRLGILGTAAGTFVNEQLVTITKVKTAR